MCVAIDRVCTCSSSHLHQGSLEVASKYGSFIELTFSEPVGSARDAVFRLHWRFLLRATATVYENTHLLNVRLSEQGLVTFIDAYYDPAPVDALMAAIADHATTAGGEAAVRSEGQGAGPVAGDSGVPVK